MKKIAIFGSDNDRSLASLVGFLQNASIIVVAPIESPLAVKAKYLGLDVVESLQDDLNIFDLFLQYDAVAPVIPEVETVKLHPALLPAFNTKSPLKDAYLSGVKVSGVTVYSVSRDKIVAQFPVLLENDSHYDEYVESITKAENLLYPLVVKSILENRVFNFSDIMGNSAGHCSGNCGSCSGGCK